MALQFITKNNNTFIINLYNVTIDKFLPFSITVSL